LLVFPTAMHADGAVQATPLRVLDAAPGGLFAASTVHLEPFHRSACVAGDWWFPFGVEYPTAVQAVPEVHATPISWVVPAGLGVAWRCHDEPSQRSASGWGAPELLKLAPTALQADGDVHATLLRNANEEPAGVGVNWSDQRAPFHRAAKVTEIPERLMELPTAVHADADVQDTPFSVAPPRRGFGVDWMVHRVPFHRSARVVALGLKGLAAPTAVHADADVQATPLRKPLPCRGLGVDWMVHRVPFHRSARVPAFELPTAVHTDADVQDTPPRKPPPCRGLGVDWMVHRVPFHRSARVSWLALPGLDTPTAVHADAEVQDTLIRVLTAAPEGLGVRSTRQE